MADMDYSADESVHEDADPDAQRQQRPSQTPRRHSPRAGLILRRRTSIPHRRSPAEAIDPARPVSLDWPTWLGIIERKRKLFQRNQTLHSSANGFATAPPGCTVPLDLLVRATS